MSNQEHINAESDPIDLENKDPKDGQSLSTPPPDRSTITSLQKIQHGKKRKLTSDVWDHMTRVEIDGVGHATCNYCKTTLKAASTSGTTALRNHLARCPKRNTQDIEAALKRQRQIVEIKKSDSKSTYTNFNFDQEKSRKELACAIILHEYPLSIVEHRGFRKFVTSLQPYFKMISRNTIKNDIMKVYDIEKEKLKEVMQHCQSRVAITTDMWTSNQRKGYMSITVHFIDEDWVLQSRILRFVYVPAPHTMDVLAEYLLEGLVAWHLETKLSTITVDNCSTNDGMINIILDKLSSHCLLEGRYIHLRCGAHILNLIVKDGLSVIDQSIAKIRESVAYWSATASRIEKFEDVARQLKVSCTKKLCLDCKTRWNSTFLMLQTAIEYKDVFPRLKLREKKYSSLPAEKDWERAALICGKLKLFYHATEAFSATNYPTSHIFYIKICEIKEALDKWIIESPDQDLVLMAQKMREKFNRYWSDVHIVMSIPIILDPRYKMKAIQFYFKSFYGDDAYLEIEKAKSLCYALLNEYKSKVPNASATKSSCGTLDAKFIGEEGSSHARLVEMLRVESSDGVVKSEFEYYLDEKVLPYAQDFDILGWWKTHGIKYPTLQLIARDFFAILVSTVASESAFSSGGRVVSLKRNRLHKDTLEAIMCSQSWLRSQVEDTVSSERCCTMEDDEDDEEYQHTN